MTELLLIYKWSLVCGALNAASLAILGAHLATRDRALQSLSISQAATLGVLLGVGILGHAHDSFLAHTGPLLLGLGMAAIIFLLSERHIGKDGSIKVVFYLSLYIGLLAICYGAIALLPGLESHLSSAFFGDIVTINGAELWISIAASAAALIWFQQDFVTHLRESFEIAVFGEEYPSLTSGKTRFRWLSLLLLTISIFSMGLLFTIAMLFIPTTILRSSKNQGVKAHLFFAALASVAGTLAGLILSIRWDKAPTVPSIVILTIAFSLALSRWPIANKSRSGY
jgi:ABC-type Mn2+/Zn2+ transport system permease subunit